MWERELRKPRFIKATQMITWLFLQLAKGQSQVGKPRGVCDLSTEHNTAPRGTGEESPRREDFKWKNSAEQKGGRKWFCLFAAEQNKLRTLFEKIHGNTDSQDIFFLTLGDLDVCSMTTCDYIPMAQG